MCGGATGLRDMLAEEPVPNQDAILGCVLPRSNLHAELYDRTTLRLLWSGSQGPVVGANPGTLHAQDPPSTVVAAQDEWLVLVQSSAYHTPNSACKKLVNLF